jgi:hypothetical protein
LSFGELAFGELPFGELRRNHRNYLRMIVRQFDELLLKVIPLIVRQNTNFRCAVSPGERLAKLTNNFLLYVSIKNWVATIRNNARQFVAQFIRVGRCVTSSDATELN